ncbi:peptidase domain-containing ABC transporter [Kitasatospora sp. NPDC056138]|uniref:peptidase domain-containing ABC transporter n=1 Tax=Kitasatospora sp. NPDC056138 TaxID=3345724 RepID=UPI0035DACF0A
MSAGGSPGSQQQCGQGSGNRPRFRSQALSARGASREYGPPVGPASAAGPSRAPKDHRFKGAAGPWWQLGRVRRVPVRLQAQTSDCGAAALGMVLAFHNVDVPLQDLRQATGTGRDGVSARQILEAAREYGFNARGVRVGLHGLQDLPPATILFWDFTHFVVLERVSGGWAYIVDPAFGRRRITLAAAGESFTGVALQITPGLDTAHDRSGRRTARRSDKNPWLYLRHFFPHGLRWLPFIVCSLLLLLFNLGMPLATRYVVDSVVPGRQFTGAGYLWLGIPVLATAYFALQLIRSLSMLTIQTAVDENVTLSILNRLFALPYDFFTNRSPGDLLQRVRTGSAIRQVLSVSAFSTAFDGILILVYMTLLVLADHTLALLVIAMAMFQVGLLVVAWRKQEYASADALEARARAESELAEILEGMATLKAAGVEEAASHRWSHSLAEELNTRLRSRRLLTLSSTLSSALQLAAPLVILAVGSLRASAGILSLGDVLGFSVLAMGLLGPLANLVQVGLQVSGLAPELARLSDIIEATPEKRSSARSIAVRGELEVRDVFFAYQTGRAEVLSGVSFRVPRGSFTTVLGASGSGKSSCALLLAGLHNPTIGQILVGGHELSVMDTIAYRRSIAFVNQDSRLFSGTIRENIALGGSEVSEAEVTEAARLAGIHDDVARMPMGYDTLLASGGAGISGGQRQRIILARALVRRPRLLILDEATSALDPVLETEIFERLRHLGITLVVIAHRLSVIESADQVVVLEAGKVVQYGSPQELSSQTGPYRALVGA